MDQSGGGVGCRSSNLMMGFGSDNSNTNNNGGGGGGLSTMMMMMNMPPPLTSSSANYLHNHHHNNNSNNTTTATTTVGYFFNEQQHQSHNMSSSCSTTAASMLRAKIMAHPLYPRLLAAYLNCQKVGAPPEVVARLEDKGAACVAMSARSSGHSRRRSSSCVGVDGDKDEDPALDQFMEAYCEMLIKYEQELTKPFNEAMLFLSKIESQFKALTVNASACGEAVGRNGSSDEDIDGYSMNEFNIDPQAVDRELKGQLLRKYSGYLGSLKQEFLKKKKKGKLPKEATAQLLDWWTRHYKWPYPSEQQKLALAESTGLDQKQINNWFINQRKRHWKPTEEMQFVVMGAPDSHYYLENVVGNPFPMDCTAALL